MRFLLLSLLALLTACSGPSAEAVEELENTGVDLYAPSSLGKFQAVTVVEEGLVKASLKEASTGETLWLAFVEPGASLCAEAEAFTMAGSECQETATGFTASFEEWTTVGVLRGSTLVVVSNLVTEVSPELEGKIAEELRTAPRLSAEQFLSETDS